MLTREFNEKKIAIISQFMRRSSSENPVVILDSTRPVQSTASAMTWYTSKPCQPVKKSQISHIVVDSGWEQIGFEFERNRIKNLISWAKNNHPGFEIFYLYQGKQHVCYPDFLLKFKNDKFVIIEVKGRKKEQDSEKWWAAQEWVAEVNQSGRFGNWAFNVLEKPEDLWEILK